MIQHSHLASSALMRKPASRGKRAPRAPSIVGWFSPQPWLESVAGTIAPDVCHLVRAAAPVSPSALREDEQSGNRLATIPDWPEAVETVVRWPKCVLPELRRHG